jgi:hypothetical protein
MTLNRSIEASMRGSSVALVNIIRCLPIEGLTVTVRLTASWILVGRVGASRVYEMSSDQSMNLALGLHISLYTFSRGEI